MPTNWKGYGRFMMRETDGTLRPGAFSKVSFSSEATSEASEAYPLGSCGPIGEVDSTVNKIAWKLTVEQQSVDRQALERIFDRKFTNTSTEIVPTIATYPVPATGPAEVAIAGITSTDDISVALLQDTAPGNLSLTKVGAAPAAGEFQVTAGKILVNSSEAAGKNIFVYRRKALTTAEYSIGGTNPVVTLGNMEFYGTACNARLGTFHFWMPSVARESGVDFASDAGEYSVEYKMLTPSGWPDPYKMWVATA